MSVSYKGKKISLPVIAYGGMVHSNYMMGMINLVNKLAALGMSVSCPSIWFESLISRARNASAAAALSNKDDYLMFIDTDVAFDALSFGFCKVWQECGGKIHALTDIKLKHRGNIEFEGDFNKQREIFYK
jgi:hypothetical protein